VSTSAFLIIALLLDNHADLSEPVHSHTRRRADYPEIIDSFLNGVTANYSWTQFPGVDVLMGGGAENFQPCEDGCSSYKSQDYYQLFAERGYSVVQDKDELDGASASEKLLGIFSTGNLDKWLDRNVFPENTRGNGNSPKNDGTDADNQPGLKAMTMKAIEGTCRPVSAITGHP
jgi:alkaline phosphatase